MKKTINKIVMAVIGSITLFGLAFLASFLLQKETILRVYQENILSLLMICILFSVVVTVFISFIAAWLASERFRYLYAILLIGFYFLWMLLTTKTLVVMMQGEAYTFLKSLFFCFVVVSLGIRSILYYLQIKDAKRMNKKLGHSIKRSFWVELNYQPNNQAIVIEIERYCEKSQWVKAYTILEQEEPIRVQINEEQYLVSKECTYGRGGPSWNLKFQETDVI